MRKYLFGLMVFGLLTSFALAAEPTAENKDPNTLVVFTSTTCGPCRAMLPDIAKVKKAGVSIRTADVDKNEKQANKLNITKTPTTVLVDAKGKILDRRTGKLSFKELLQMARPKNRVKDKT